MANPIRNIPQILDERTFNSRDYYVGQIIYNPSTLQYEQVIKLPNGNIGTRELKSSSCVISSGSHNIAIGNGAGFKYEGDYKETFTTRSIDTHQDIKNVDNVKNSDQNLIKLFINRDFHFPGLYYQKSVDQDNNDCYDFEFIPSLEENDERLDSFITLKGKVISSEEKKGDGFINKIFGKKKVYIKKIRVIGDEMLKIAKKTYCN